MGPPLREAGILPSSIPSAPPLPIPKLGGVLALASQVRKLRAHLHPLRPGLVHAFLPTPCIIAWLAHFGMACPLVMSKRSQMCRPAAFACDKPLEIRALRAADRVLAHSRAVKKELEEHGIASDIVHNGIDLDVFSRPPDRLEIRRREGWPEDGLILTVLANLIPYKGHEDLLRALACRAPSGEWRLICVGAGSAAPLQGLAQNLGIGNNVLFTGDRGDIPDLLGASDIGILPSHHEGFSNALLEYMAAGLPVIATDVGGNPDAVIDGETGFLVPPQTPEALAEALARMDDAIRRTMGQAGRERVSRHFDLGTCVSRYDAFYRDVLMI